MPFYSDYSKRGASSRTALEGAIRAKRDGKFGEGVPFRYFVAAFLQRPLQTAKAKGDLPTLLRKQAQGA